MAGSSDPERMALLRVEYAILLAHARAAIAAMRDGEADPLGYVRDVLVERGQLPPAAMHPAQLLASAHDVMASIGGPRVRHDCAFC